MSKMKAEAIELVEKALKKFGQYEDGFFHDSLMKELLEIGHDSFVDAYLPETKLQPPEHWYSERPPSSSIRTGLVLTGPIMMRISTNEVMEGGGRPNKILGATVHIATPKGAAEIYFNDPDTVMKVMAALARAGSILGGKTDGYSDSTSA